MVDWKQVHKHLEEIIVSIDPNGGGRLRYGQEFAAREIMNRLESHGAILADEVGLGKTRVALLLMEAVLRAGGTVAVVAPRGLMFQWETEAKDFATTITNPRIAEGIKKLANFQDLFDDEIEYPITANEVLAKEEKSICRWPLISQRFGLIHGRTENLRRYDFFGLVAYKLRNEKNEPKKWNKYYKDLKEKDNFKQLEKAVRSITIGKRLYPTLSNINAPINYNGSLKVLQKTVQSNTGKREAKDLMGALIGNVDFLVIDEAHKEKDNCAKNEPKILVSLLKDIIKRSIFPEDIAKTRTLCLTATPIEMSVEDWKLLLARCGKNVNESECQILKNFQDALEEANLYPDNERVLKDLVENACPAFSNFLKEYVVRRRRCHQKEHLNLLKGIETAGLAHPYRKIQEQGIDMNSLPDNWKKAVLCYEGVACASKGTIGTSDSTIQKDKRLQCKYPAGLIDFEDEKISFADVVDAKEKRRLFWKKLGNQYARANDHSLRTHPKIQQTADLVEKLIENSDEKVLVFGTFTTPMIKLRDELNFRYIARRIEKGVILKSSLSKGDETEVFETYRRLFPEGTYAFDMNTFVETAGKLHNRYESLQRRLYENQVKDVELLFDSPNPFISDKDSQKTYKSIREKNVNLFNRILECARMDVLNSFVDDNDNLSEESFERNRNEVLNRYSETLTGYLTDLLSLDDAVEDSNLDEDAKIAKSIDAFGRYLENNSDDSISSRFCRFMFGDTKWDTRRRLQRQFNTPGISPRVLIAQSIVGREGLNLHKCCRKVVLFHPEWNPGVVEQQIGRVDRIDSLWNKTAEKWQKNSSPEKKAENFPHIEVYYVIFKGTYDQHQFNVMKSRATKMDAQLFGALLSEEALERVPAEMKETLANAAPDFEPAQD